VKAPVWLEEEVVLHFHSEQIRAHEGMPVLLVTSALHMPRALAVTTRALKECLGLWVYRYRRVNYPLEHKNAIAL